jgi:hypothetical protein
LSGYVALAIASIVVRNQCSNMLEGETIAGLISLMLAST